MDVTRKLTKALCDQDLMDVLKVNPKKHGIDAGPNTQDHQIWIGMDRSGTGPFYALDKDGWFRMIHSRVGADGYGLAIRRFKLGKFMGTETFSSKGNFEVWNVNLSYLPSAITDPDEDTSKNWERANGVLYIMKDAGVSAQDVSQYIRVTMSKWVP